MIYIEKRRKSGFTFIEVIMAVIILGIVTAISFPKYLDLQTQAKANTEGSILASVRTGIANYHANQCVTTNCAYPLSLDSASNGKCAADNVCFDIVLSQGGITSDWSKRGSVYVGPTGKRYVYNNANGSFSSMVLVAEPVPFEPLEKE